MGALATVLADRIERWRNARFRAEMRRVLAREATSSLGSARHDPVLDELEERIWSHVDAQETVRHGYDWHRVLSLVVPAAAAALLVYALLTGLATGKN
jgi:hypothetical protein